MNDSPKPLPDDFGMTIPNLRLPKQNQAQNQGDAADLPTTNLRNAPPPKPASPNMPPPMPPSEDFGMTVPNLRLPKNHQPPPQQQSNFNDDYGSPTTDLRGIMPGSGNQPPRQPNNYNFDETMNNYGQSSSNQEQDFGATMMSYIPKPQQQQRETVREEYRETIAPVAAPPVAAPPKRQEKKRGVPVWAWLLSGGLAFLALLGIGLLLAYFFLFRDTGFTLVIKGAPAGSAVFIDGQRRGVTSEKGEIKIFGVEADKKRNIKVTQEGFTDFNDTVLGENGETKEIIAQMKKTDAPPVVDTPKPTCAEDPRVCEAENQALDALDKLTAPFTVDQWVAAMNLQVVNFDSNSADVPPARKRVLEKGAEKFKLITGNPGVEVGGHTDNVGGDGANQQLSENRAQAVRFILVNNGVNAKAFTTRGFGSKKQKVSNDTEEGRFQNRRIEYSVTSR